MAQKIGLALAAVLASVAPSLAAEQEQWGFYQSPDEARLFYGVPESEAIAVAFICERKPHRIVIVATGVPPGAKAGRRTVLRLGNGAQSARYAGTFVYDRDEGGVHFEATTPARRSVFALLKTGRTLGLAVGGTRDTLPLRGAAPALAKLEAACFGRR